MTRVLVLYYSAYGHVETLAWAIADGAGAVPGTAVDVKRVPELVPREVALASGMKLEQRAAIAEPTELAQYDAIVVGTPTRFGNMSAQMRNFLDQTGALWQRGALIGKVGAAFVATGTQHGGQEVTLQSVHTTLLHHGMVVVGVPYAIPEMLTMGEVAGGSPYGATTISGPRGDRQPSAVELAIARYQGRHVAAIAEKLRR